MFKGFITNLGLYNEGYCVLDIGEWVTFPIAEEEITKIFERIHLDDTHEEYFFTDWSCDNNFDPYDYFGEYANINHVNDVAETLEDYFHEDERKTNAILEIQDVRDIRNMLDDGYDRWYLDKYMFLAGINDDCELGEYLISEWNCELAKVLEDNGIENYFNYETYGRDNSYNGSYTSEGYLEYIG